MPRIFISYKREDKNKVFPLKKRIEAATGEKCWIDLDGIESDAQFANVIIKAIDEADIFLFMYSKRHAKIIDYEKDWTVREINYAQKLGKKIVFINIDGNPLTKWFEFMFGLKQQVDATSEESFNNLLQDICKWLGETVNLPMNLVNKKKRRYNVTYICVAVVFLISIVVVGIVLLKHGDNHNGENLIELQENKGKNQIIAISKEDLEKASGTLIWPLVEKEAQSRLEKQKGKISAANTQKLPIAYVNLVTVVAQCEYIHNNESIYVDRYGYDMHLLGQQAKELKEEFEVFEKDLDAGAYLIRESAESEYQRLLTKQKSLQESESQIKQNLETNKQQLCLQLFDIIDKYANTLNATGSYYMVFLNNQYDDIISPYMTEDVTKQAIEYINKNIGE